MASERVPPPRDLDVEAKRLWRATRKELERQETWQDGDVPLLERYVRASARARLARSEITKPDGSMTLTAVGSQGQLVQHPNVKTWREAERDAHEYAGALLLTPEARKRHDIKPKRVGAFDGAFA